MSTVATDIGGTPALSPEESTALLQLCAMGVTTPETMRSALKLSRPAIAGLVSKALVVEQPDGALLVDNELGERVLASASPPRRRRAHRLAARCLADLVSSYDPSLVVIRDRNATAMWCSYVYNAVAVWPQGEMSNRWTDFAWVMEALAGGQPVAWRLRLAQAAERAIAGNAITDTHLAIAACVAGAALHELGDPARGVELCGAGMAWSKDARRSDYVDRLLISAECLMDHGRVAEVESGCRRAVKKRLTAESKARAWLWLGKVLYRQGQLDEALAAYEMATPLETRLRPSERAVLWGFISNVRLDRGERDAAFDAAQHALRLARAALSEQEVATQLVNLALASRRMGRDLEAQQLCEKASRIYRRLGYWRGLGTTWRIRANASRSRGELRQAWVSIKKSVACHSAAGYVRGEAMSSGVAAEIAADRGEVEIAGKRYAQAITLAREIGDDRTLAINLLRAGLLLAKDQDRREEAERLLIEAHAVAVRSGLTRVRTNAEAEMRSALAMRSSPTSSDTLERNGDVGEGPILLVATTDVEIAALRTALAEAGLSAYEFDRRAGSARVGILPSGRAVWMLRLVQMGTTGVGGSLLSIHEAANALGRPTVILVGIAFGVEPRRQRVGDVLVADRLLMYEQQRAGSDGHGQLDVLWRGQLVDAPPGPLRAFHFIADRGAAGRVQFGAMLTGEKLIDNLDYRKSLESLSDGAIGGEMEAAGLYSAAVYRGLEWGCVKAICDFADGKKSTNKKARQQRAAACAAQFVVQSLSSL